MTHSSFFVLHSSFITDSCHLSQLFFPLKIKAYVCIELKNIRFMRTLLITLCACLLTVGTQAQSLTLEVRDIDRPTGTLYVAIYSSAETFLSRPLTGFRVEVKDKQMSIPCQGLPAGTYALCLFQDVNGNGTLDTGAYGIPTEPTGFSNDAQGVMGPPDFESCSFTLRQDTTVVVHLR